MSRLKSRWSFWALVALLVVLGLQVFPIPGVFMMIIGGPFWAGLLVHVFLLALAFEAVTGRIWRVFLIVPLVAYGAYYAMYFQQGLEIAQKSAELKAANPGKILNFDSRTNSLVMKDAQALVTVYAVPVAYEANNNFKSEGHLSYRLFPRSLCNFQKDTQNRILTSGVHFEHRLQPVCVLQFPEAPPLKILSVERHGDDEVWKRKTEISEQVTEIRSDGQVLGAFRTASVWRLPGIPMMGIGCSLISSMPAWKCGADFMRTHVVIDTLPEGIDRAIYESPVSVMLGLRKYTASDLANFRGYDENAPFLVRLALEPAKVEDEVFQVLQAVIDGQNPKVPYGLGASVAKNPARLAPFAAGMARRFVELNDRAANKLPNLREQREALETAIPALPREAFGLVAAQMFDVVRTDEAADRFPVLYVRAADAGAMTLDFYQRTFMAEKLRPLIRSLPVLAICRVGQASPETIAEMKRRLVSAGDEADHYEYRTAMFVTLLKLGEEKFLRDNLGSISWRSRTWATDVLDKKGATDVGPNNCMARKWPTTRYVSPIMAPGLP